MPLAIAHRGGGLLALENTFDAFAHSYALGVRYFETDVRLTRDHVPVLFHDADLRRVVVGDALLPGFAREWREKARLGRTLGLAPAWEHRGRHQRLPIHAGPPSPKANGERALRS